MRDVRPPLLRTSERKDFRRCPWLWEQGWLNGLSPRRSPTWSVFGRAIHSALEYFYVPGYRRTAADMEDAVEVFLEQLGDEARKVGVDLEELEGEEAERAEARGSKVKLIPASELGPEMLRNYWKLYGPESEWEVIHTEQPFQIDVPYPSGPKSSVLVVYAGTWDALMRHKPTRRLWLWDHKTAKSIPAIEYLDLDDQAGSYLWVAKEVLVHKGILTKSDRISGIVFNYLKKAPADDRPVNARGHSMNKDGTISKRQPAPRFLRHEAVRTPYAQVQQAQRVQKEAVVMNAMRNGDLPIYKNTTHDCPRCVLFDLCTAHEEGEDWELLRDTMYIKRDKYADHREDMERAGIEL